MASLNKAMVIGNLGRDPEIRTTPSGTTVVNFSIATTEYWNDRDGNRQESTEWHRIVAFGKLADICGKYLSKGRSVYVEGRIQTRKWDDKDGNTRYTTEIVANVMQMLGGRGQGQGGGDGGSGDPYENEGKSYSGGRDEGPPPDLDDDIPF